MAHSLKLFSETGENTTNWNLEA